MAYVVYDLQDSPTYDGQAGLDRCDVAALAAAAQGQGVVTGCGVCQHTGSDYYVNVAAGSVVINGLLVAVSAVTGTSLGPTTAGTYDRRDIVVVNSSGVVSITAGTQCGTTNWTRSSSGLPPVKPAIPANSIILGELYIFGGATTVTTAMITDKTARVLGEPGGLLARAMWAPSGAGAYTLVNITTGVTALDSTNLSVTFTGPPSGFVRVHLGAMVEGHQVAGDGIVFAVVSSTGSPGTLVGVTGIVYKSPSNNGLDRRGVVHDGPDHLGLGGKRLHLVLRRGLRHRDSDHHPPGRFDEHDGPHRGTRGDRSVGRVMEASEVAG